MPQSSPFLSPVPYRVAVVDDDETLRAVLRGYLADEGFDVVEAEDERQLRAVLARFRPDALLLDIRLPSKDGLTLTRELRAESDVGVILITGRGDAVDRILGLEYGADDFLDKPINARELLPRLRNLCRRVRLGAPQSATRVQVGAFLFDLQGRRLESTSGEAVPLTTAEYALLAALVRSPGRVLTRDQLIAATGRERWNPLDRTVDTLIARLRRKIEVDPERPRLIATVHGAGYIYTP